MIQQQYADRAWEQVKRFWTHLNLNRPKAESLGKEIACFDLASKQIYFDEANLEQRLGAGLLRPVLNHEAGHHKLCPYGLRGFVRLVAYANKITQNIKLAKLAENLFADLLINTHLYKRGEKPVKAIYQKFSEQNGSKSWQFYISTFEHMIGEPGSILKDPPEEEVCKDAQKISEILAKSLYHSEEWPKSISEFAKYVKKYVGDEKQNAKPGGQGLPGLSVTGQGNGSGKPLIDEHGAKDFLPFDKNKTPAEQQAKHVEMEIKGLAREVGLNDFKKVIAGLGLGTESQAKIWFYKDLAAMYSLEMPVSCAGIKSGRPSVPRKWRTSDPAERLNIEYSLSNFGVLVPNVTTYQFVSEEFDRSIPGNEAPDLLIALDSSGSMPNPDSRLSFPVLSAMLAAQTALERGKKVAIINFSSSYKHSDFTNNISKIDEIITAYFGGGTVIPGDKIRELVAKHNHPTHILIISDTAIYNLTDQIENLEYSLKEGRAGGTIFIDCTPSEQTKLLTSIGFDVQFTRNFDDLAELTLKKARGLYETKSKTAELMKDDNPYT